MRNAELKASELTQLAELVEALVQVGGDADQVFDRLHDMIASAVALAEEVRSDAGIRAARRWALVEN